MSISGGLGRQELNACNTYKEWTALIQCTLNPSFYSVSLEMVYVLADSRPICELLTFETSEAHGGDCDSNA